MKKFNISLAVLATLCMALVTGAVGMTHVDESNYHQVMAAGLVFDPAVFHLTNPQVVDGTPITLVLVDKLAKPEKIVRSFYPAIFSACARGVDPAIWNDPTTIITSCPPFPR